jgi:glucan phosphoethanolaminetransferase (alkaline phosphatase superfamily)
MKIKAAIGVPAGFAIMVLFWLSLPLGWLDSLFPIAPYAIAIGAGALAGMFIYGVVVNEKALKAFKDQLNDTKAVNAEGDSARSMALGYLKWLACFAAINIVFTILRHSEL